MLSILLGLHFALTLAIIGLILIQKHDSDGALGSSGGGAASGMFSVRGQANILTKSTAILMTVFMVNCLVMAKMTKHKPSKLSVIDKVEKESVYKPKHKSDEEIAQNARNGLGPDGKPMPKPPSDLSKLKGYSEQQGQKPRSKPLPDLSKKTGTENGAGNVQPKDSPKK